MQDLKKPAPKKPKKEFVNQNPLESLESIFGGVKTSMIDDLGKGGAKDAKNQILDLEPQNNEKSDQGDLSEGAELDLTALQEKAIEITEMGRAYSSEVIHAGKRAENETSQEIQVKMQEILIEIKKISESSEELKEQVDVISLEKTSENPGIYHLSLYEQILSKLQEFRIGLDDSLAWFKALRSKNASKQYKAQAKQHGTSFTLSGERQVATQVG